MVDLHGVDARLTTTHENAFFMSALVRSPRVLMQLLPLLLIVPASACADFYDRPFELRLLMTVDRQSNYASTLGRQASVAFFDGASTNPGAAAWYEAPQSSMTTTASFVDAPSTGGRQVIAAPVSARWRIPAAGTFSFAYAYTDTPEAKGDDGLNRSLRSDEWIGGYGKRINEQLSAGFTVRFTSGQIVNESPIADFGNQVLRNTTHFHGPDVSVGIAADLDSRWTMGIVGGFGIARATVMVTNVNPLVVPLSPTGPLVTLPPDTLLDQERDTIRTYVIRAGIGFRPTESTGIYFDSSGLHASTNRSGSQSVGRFLLGIEHRPAEGWAVRGGVGVDTIGQVTWSTGVGYRFSDTVDAQFAFQNNGAPEVNPELGRTRLYMGSVAWTF
jgi:hypothetical protein